VAGRGVAGEAELWRLADVDHVAPVRDAGQARGALTLQAKPGRDLTPHDLRLAADVANAAGLLLRNAELTERLREQVRVETAQAAELTMSRRRVVVARDAAREQLGAEIQARVCEPLARCVVKAELARPGRAESLAGRRLAAELAEMTREIDAAIADFRTIVHGIYPPVLTDHGLLAAMESLLTSLDLRAKLVTHRIPRLAARVEAGTYFCAAALLREWDQTGAQRPLRVVAGVTSKLVQMAFIDGVPETAARADLPVSPPVLEAVRDRVAALEGTLRAARDASGRSLVIEIPLAPADLATPRVRRRARQ
jgi:signal transduction histidine kinase